MNKNKRAGRLLATLLMLAVMVMMLASCTVDELAGMLGSDTKNDGVPASGTNQGTGNTSSPGADGNNASGGASGEYISRAELDEILAGINQNVTVNQNNISIASQHERNLLAASKGVLSVVSITATFDVTYTYGGTPWSSPSTQTKQETSGGAGVIYTLDKARGDAYIITNYHVVYNVNSDADDKISDEIYLYLYGQEYEAYQIPATYVGGSMIYDIAVLKVSGNDVIKNSSAMAASFANSDEISVLQTAIAIGNPANLGISATVGAVNVVSEVIEITAVDEKSQIEMRVIRIDAAVNGGNSGGGLFDEGGNVIGIVNAKITSSSIDNIGYAIPANVAKSVADNIIYYDNLSVDNDSAMRVVLGIDVGITSSRAEYDSTSGKVLITEQVQVDTVTAGSAAEAAGLCASDIINSVTIDGVRYDITHMYMVSEVMLNARQGSVVIFNVTRGDVTVDITVDVSAVTPAKVA